MQVYVNEIKYLYYVKQRDTRIVPGKKRFENNIAGDYTLKYAYGEK